MTPVDQLHYRYAYWEDTAARQAFQRFLHGIHGLDLSLWEQAGFWDHTLYTPFSLFEGEEIVSSVCLFSMEMVVEGVPQRWGQFSGVGTLPAYRRRGLARWLTERALEWAAPSQHGFFLFADGEALTFYADSGFRRVEEAAPLLRVEPPRPRAGLRKLDMDDPGDQERVFRLAREREAVSERLGCLNARLAMFHCLYGLREKVHWIEDLGVAVLLSCADRRLTLYDVIGPEIPPLRELHPYLAHLPHQELCFQFMIDKMGIEPSGQLPLDGNHAHVNPSLSLPAGEFVFPYLARA